MLGLHILDVQVAERAVDVADHALVAVASFVGTRLLVNVRLPALGRLLDRLAAGLLDLGARGGELLPDRILAPGDGRSRLVMRVAGLLERDRFGPSPHSLIEWVRRLPSSR